MPKELAWRFDVAVEGISAHRTPPVLAESNILLPSFSSGFNLSMLVMRTGFEPVSVHAPMGRFPALSH